MLNAYQNNKLKLKYGFFVVLFSLETEFVIDQKTIKKWYYPFDTEECSNFEIQIIIEAVVIYWIMFISLQRLYLLKKVFFNTFWFL